MVAKLGIRREDKNEWERRVPLTPGQVGQLVGQGIEVAVQPSGIRAFPDQVYLDAGASVSEDLSDCQVVLAVKEIPKDFFVAGSAYVFFAHVIKGQPYNMPMLQKLLSLGCTLIDYEKIVDDDGRRLVLFGRHAGLAGMMDSLWALGQRLEREGFSTPFAGLRATHGYPDLDAILAAVRMAGTEIASSGLPRALTPMVFGFAGYGNVSLGAQEVFDQLPHRAVAPDDLADLLAAADPPPIVKVVFREEHMVRPREPGHTFELQEYYDHPERYAGDFEKYVPMLSVLVNCIYWAPQYPRLVSRRLLRDLYMGARPARLRVIGDISCDVEGAVECTLKCTEPSDPVYVYKPEEDQIAMGVQGNGPVVLAVDNLPCELAVESSTDFGKALMPLVPGILSADFSRPFDEIELPAPIRRAVIAHRGALTPDYGYLEEKLDTPQGGPK